MSEGKEKEDLKVAIGAAGNNQNWYADMIKTEATTKFETIVKTADTDAKLQDTLNNAKNLEKETIEAYFKTTGSSTYETNIGTKTFIVTQDLKATKPYTVKEKTTK